MNSKTVLGFAILVLAFAFLVPGIMQPMLDLDGQVEKTDLVELGKQLVEENNEIPTMLRGAANMMLDKMDTEGTVQAYHKSRSILSTIEDLFASGNRLVAILIMTFSIVVPVLKGLLLLLASLPVKAALKSFAMTVSGLISKWSMADVFVVAIIVAYLAGNANPESDELLHFSATLGPGFYYFLAYCILSIVSAQILSSNKTAG